METREKELDFLNPPVREVVLSILFKPLDQFLAPHLGEIWQEFKKFGFVDTTVQAPIPATVESFSDQIPETHVRISNIPDFDRILFIHENGEEILQVQRDRFTFNWREIKDGQRYPGLSVIFTKFKDFYTHFRKNLKNQGIGEIILLQYELGYINRFRHEDGWNTLGDIGKIFNIFVDSQQSNLFWDNAEFLNLRTSFPIKHLPGRLHLGIGSWVKIPEQTQTLQIDFAMRGFPESGEDQMEAWFKAAAAEIREKFTSIFIV